jgi:putative CocE/NonD family hydrolase
VTKAIILIIATITLLGSGDNSHADFVRSHYQKYEKYIPMRDGVRLFTSIYVPADRSQKYPILLNRTPYRVAPYGEDNYKSKLGPTQAYDKEGFIFVFQDVRGRFMSEGEFVNMRPHIADKAAAMDIDESTDTWDSIEWLINNIDGHNGKVGMVGISYPGFYASAGAINSHPNLKAVSPQAPIADWYWDDMHHHGALIQPLTIYFFNSFGRVREGPEKTWPPRMQFHTPDAYEFYLSLGTLANVEKQYFKNQVPFWTHITQHPNYDAFWQSRNILPHLKNIDAAVLVVGGWFDSEDLYGPLKTYEFIEKQNRGTENKIVMGPWIHGGWVRTSGESLGQMHFGFATSAGYQSEIELPFFLHHLKDHKAPDIAEATMFDTGRKQWRHFSEWPPERAQQRPYFLNTDYGISRQMDEQNHYHAFISDPAKPVPYTLEIDNKLVKSYMTEDQRFASQRPDVLVYQTPVLTDNLTLAGPIEVDLWVSTSAGDADWVVKVIDVLPGDAPDISGFEHGKKRGGRQYLIRGDIFRGRYRNSYEKPEPFEAHKPTRVRFELMDILHTFKPGHRLMIHIQSTWFPLADRNPQKYVPNIYEAKTADFISAEHKVYTGGENASKIRIKVIN